MPSSLLDAATKASVEIFQYRYVKGSGVVVRVGEKHYLATATHVLKSMPTHYRLSTDSSKRVIPGTWRTRLGVDLALAEIEPTEAEAAAALELAPPDGDSSGVFAGAMTRGPVSLTPAYPTIAYSFADRRTTVLGDSGGAVVAGGNRGPRVIGIHVGGHSIGQAVTVWDGLANELTNHGERWGEKNVELSRLNAVLTWALNGLGRAAEWCAGRPLPWIRTRRTSTGQD